MIGIILAISLLMIPDLSSGNNNTSSCCPRDLNSGYEWSSTPPGVTESVQCSLASVRLHPNSQARRTCSPSGEWGPVDVSGCTFLSRKNVSGVVIVTVNTTATRGEVVSSTGVERLRNQLLTRLGGYDVQNLIPKNSFEGSGDENTVLVMEGSLPLTINSSILGVFEVEGVPSGYFNFTTPPKLVVYIPTESCECGASSADELKRLCLAPEDAVASSASSCRCYGNCSCQPPYTRTTAAGGDEQLTCTLQDLQPLSVSNCTATVGATCPSGSVSLSSPPLTTMWSATQACRIARQTCPIGYVGYAFRSCDGSGQWEEPDLSQCERVAISNVLRVALSDLHRESSTALRSIQQIVNDSSTSSLNLSSSCYQYFTTKLQFQRFSPTEPFSLTGPFLPMELSSVVNYIHSISRIAALTNLFETTTYSTERLVELIQALFSSSSTHEGFWTTWISNKPSEAILLLEGTREILIQLAGRLDQFSFATDTGGGVYLWNMTQQREFGIEAEFLTLANLTQRIYLRSSTTAVQDLERVTVETNGTVTSVAYFGNVFSDYLPKAFVNQSSLGVSVVHPVVVSVGGEGTVSVNISFRSSNASLELTGHCVRWRTFSGSGDGLYSGGWSEEEVQTSLTEHGYACVCPGPGVYGVIEVGRIRVSPDAVRVYPGHILTLTCTVLLAVSNEFPIVWTVNGSLLLNGVESPDFAYVGIQDGGISMINISVLSVSTEERVYEFSCVTPGYPSVPVPSTVHVEPLPVLQLTISTCTEGTDLREVATGSYLCLQCSAHQMSAMYTLVWRVNGSKVSEDSNREFIVDQDLHTLTVVTPTVDYSGMYSCELTESELVRDGIEVTVKPGCLPQLFLSSAAVGSNFTKSCSSYSHNSIKSSGNVTWTCVDSLLWSGDFTQCSFNTQVIENVSILAFLVKGPISVDEQETIELIENDTRDAIQVSGASVEILDLRESGSFGTTLVVCSVAVHSEQYSLFQGILTDVFVGTFELAGLQASLSRQMSYSIVTSVTCNCPLKYAVHQVSDLSYSQLGLIQLCTTPDYVSTTCEDNQCVGVFTNIGTIGSELEPIQQCSLDTDGDGIPNHEDPCESCCVNETYGGVQWPRVPQGTTAGAPCSVLHKSLNSGTRFNRRCNELGQWEGISPFGCTFEQMANHSLAVAELKLNTSNYNVDELKSAVLEEIVGQLEMEPLEPIVTLNSVPYVLVVLMFEHPSTIDEQHVLATLGNVSTIGGLAVSSKLVYGLKPSAHCLCGNATQDLDYASEFFNLCKGPSNLLACACVSGTCECLYPFTPSHDNEGGLQRCTYSTTGSTGEIKSEDCQYEADEGCPEETSSMITWPSTRPCYTAVQMCSQNPMSGVGEASRKCSSSGQWERPNTMSCERVESRNVRMSTEELLDSFFSDSVLKMYGRTVIQEPYVQILNDSAETLMMLTGESGLFPMDLNTTVFFLTSVVNISGQSDLFTNMNFSTLALFDIINNALDVRHASLWEDLRQVRYPTSVDLLRTSEDLSVMRAQTIGEMGGTHLNRTNLMVQTALTDRQFVHNVVAIPEEFIQERVNASGSSVAVSILTLRNFTNYLINQFANSSDLPPDVSAYQEVISLQVGNSSGFSSQLNNTPIEITFKLNKENAEDLVKTAYCVFWNFTGNTSVGGWSDNGLLTSYNSSENTVTCSSTHLTSFSILVAVTQPTSPREELILHIASYIGCAISFICLVLTIIFFLSLGKALVGPKEGGKNFISFVHVNLCLSLAIGLLVFMAGIESGTSFKAACIIVAVLLHYFFLSVFGWMLCEVIVLYNLLVNVFPEKGLHFNRKKWLIFFSCIGWGYPVPVVIITLASRWNSYYVLDPRVNCTVNETDERFSYCVHACWLSTKDGVIAAFIGPMLIIILINSVLLIFVVRSLYKHWKMRSSFEGKQQGQTRQIGINLFKTMIFLLPLTGITWIIGLFAVNAETSVFAWLFLIFNSTQGIVIFLFYVLRHERVTSRLPKLRSHFVRCWRSHFRRKKFHSPSTEETAQQKQSLKQRTVRSIRQMFSPHVPEEQDTTGAYSGDGDLMATSPTSMTTSIQLEEYFWEAEV